MQYIHLLALAGVVFVLLGFYSYNKGEDKINSATWLMWVIGDSLEAVSYFAMTGDDLLKNVVPITFAIGSFVTFFIALYHRRFGFPDRIDQGVIVVDLGITAGWWQQYFGAAAANISFVATEVLSFIPMCRGILSGRERERISPWALWGVADAIFLVLVVSLQHKPEETIYPLVQMLLHFAVIACITAQERRIRASH